MYKAIALLIILAASIPAGALIGILVGQLNRFSLSRLRTGIPDGNSLILRRREALTLCGIPFEYELYGSTEGRSFSIRREGAWPEIVISMEIPESLSLYRKKVPYAVSFFGVFENAQSGIQEVDSAFYVKTDSSLTDLFIRPKAAELLGRAAGTPDILAVHLAPKGHIRTKMVGPEREGLRVVLQRKPFGPGERISNGVIPLCLELATEIEDWAKERTARA